MATVKLQWLSVTVAQYNFRATGRTCVLGQLNCKATMALSRTSELHYLLTARDNFDTMIDTMALGWGWVGTPTWGLS